MVRVSRIGRRNSPVTTTEKNEEDTRKVPTPKMTNTRVAVQLMKVNAIPKGVTYSGTNSQPKAVLSLLKVQNEPPEASFELCNRSATYISQNESDGDSPEGDSGVNGAGESGQMRRGSSVGLKK
jgi:hypothetical protein